MATVGVVVNPIAGMGGRVGLHGTDGELWALAVARGAEPSAGSRAIRALRALQGLPELQVITAPGDLGEIAVMEAGLASRVVDIDVRDRRTPQGTAAAVAAFQRAGVDLILFAGGDGTARDVLAALHADTPVLGIPAGVKIRSGAFARTPEAAGEVAAAFLSGNLRTTRAEVVDAERPDGWDQQLFGMCRVPELRDRVQPAKASGARSGGDAEVRALAAHLARSLMSGTLYLLGPGATTGMVSEELGLTPSRVGVDAVLDGRSVGRDLSEQEILDLLASHARVQCLLGVIGGQGFILGRGNQQLSAPVLRRLGRERISLLAAREKITALQPGVLWIDVDDTALAMELRGYWRVAVAPNESIMMRVETPQHEEWRAYASA